MSNTALIKNLDEFRMKWETIENIQLTVSHYVTDPGVLSLMLSRNTMLVQTLSVNLAEYGQYPPTNHIFVKDYNESTGIADELVRQKIAEKVSPVKIGFGNGWLMKLSFDAEKALQK